jgi:hypothetical protein
MASPLVQVSSTGDELSPTKAIMDLKALKDITTESSRMPPNSGILYAAKQSPDWDSPAHRGIVRITQPGLFWVSAWTRVVNGKEVIELRFKEK